MGSEQTLNVSGLLLTKEECSTYSKNPEGQKSTSSGPVTVCQPTKLSRKLPTFGPEMIPAIVFRGYILYKRLGGRT